MGEEGLMPFQECVLCFDDSLPVRMVKWRGVHGGRTGGVICEACEKFFTPRIWVDKEEEGRDNGE